MKVVHGLHAPLAERKPVLLAAGFFDGVHRGHQAVLRAAIRHSRRVGGSAWVMTFDTHPQKVLDPSSAPPLLTCLDHKIRLFAAAGLDGCLVLPFNRRLAAMEPLDFLEQLRRTLPDLQAFFIGPDWRFGRHGAGTADTLRRWALPLGISVYVIPPLRWRRAAISSTRIREAVQRGRLADARRMLGRPYSLMGVVARGRGLGRTLGFPTLNVAPCNEAHPPFGVYAATATEGTRRWNGVVNFGVRPTFAPNGPPVMEMHLLDARANLYGRSVEVFFLRRLRPEKRFASPQDLARQIRADTVRARALLARIDRQKNSKDSPCQPPGRAV